MNKIFNKKALLLLSSLLLILTFVSCTRTDKTTIISPNVSSEVKSEENESKLALEKANTYLKENDFENAKLTYEKATTIDKLNKEIYLEAKENYVAVNRFDDAYSIIQLAISNNVDTENMKSILADIKTNFATSPIVANVFEGDTYTLQSSYTIKINGEDKVVPITWTDSFPNTGGIGTFTYTGVNKEFNREFTTTLTVSPNVFDEEHCYVKNIYQSNGKFYIDADLVGFYRGDEALSEAIKDNSTMLCPNEDGSLFLNNGYYIRNNYSTLKTYEVSDDSTFYLLSYILNIPTTNSTEVTKVPYNKFEEYIKSNQDRPNDKNPRAVLCKIKFKNNVIYDISSVFTP